MSMGEKKLRGPRGRWSAKRKASIVPELPSGDDLETVSRGHGLTAATLSGWRKPKRGRGRKANPVVDIT